MRGRLKCYCGNCAACLKSARIHEKRVATTGCRCGAKNCDCARWNEIFERNHGQAARAYYAKPPAIRMPGSTLAGLIGNDVDDLYEVRTAVRAPEHHWREQNRRAAA